MIVRLSALSNNSYQNGLSNIFTTINFTRYSVTEVGALSAAGCAWSLHGISVAVAGWAQRVGAPRLRAFYSCVKTTQVIVKQ